MKGHGGRGRGRTWAASFLSLSMSASTCATSALPFFSILSPSFSPMVMLQCASLSGAEDLWQRGDLPTSVVSKRRFQFTG